jgi:hypothetical protein
VKLHFSAEAEQSAIEKINHTVANWATIKFSTIVGAVLTKM